MDGYCIKNIKKFSVRTNLVRSPYLRRIISLSSSIRLGSLSYNYIYSIAISRQAMENHREYLAKRTSLIWQFGTGVKLYIGSMYICGKTKKTYTTDMCRGVTILCQEVRTGDKEIKRAYFGDI